MSLYKLTKKRTFYEKLGDCVVITPVPSGIVIHRIYGNYEGTYAFHLPRYIIQEKFTKMEWLL